MAKSQSESPLRGVLATKQSPKLRRLPRTFQVLAMTAEYTRFAEGKSKDAWPGQKISVFRHCEKRSDEAISKRAACE